MFDERYAVYLYIIDLCTELDGLGFLASDDGTYICLLYTSRNRLERSHFIQYTQYHLLSLHIRAHHAGTSYPVSYTHLDVYKRQMLQNTPQKADAS